MMSLLASACGDVHRVAPDSSPGSESDATPGGGEGDDGSVSTDATTATCTPAPEGLVAWWRFEGDATDSVSSYNGQLVGDPVNADGRVGMGVDLDGTDDALRVDLDAELYPTGSFSLEIWVATEETTTALIDHTEYAGQPCDTVCRGLYQLKLANGAPDLLIRATEPEQGDPQRLSSETSIADGDYHHVVAVRSEEEMELRLYVDGVSIASAALAPSASGPIAPGPDGEIDPFLVGARRIGAGEVTGYLQGSVDEVSYYSRALQETEVAALHAASSAGKCQ